jgi:Na+/citrate or Na+/malate symporter
MNMNETTQIQFLRWPVFICLAIGALAMLLGELPTGMIGGMCLLLPLALILEQVGARIPILKDYLGGPPLLLIFLGAGLVYLKVIPPAGLEAFSGFMKSSGANFLDFYICGLITGAIFGINSKLLLQAGVRYLVPVLACILACCGLAAVAGGLTGYGWQEGIVNIAFPILGGGMGGGAVPMAQVIHDITGQEMKQILSVFVPALALGNVFSIIAAGLLDRLGRKYPKLSGEGQILKGSGIANEEPPLDFSVWSLVIGIAVSASFYALGKVLNHFIPAVHNLAWMVLCVAVCKITGVIPNYIISACFSWFRFVVKAFTGIILLAIGVVYTDLGALIGAVTPLYLLLCALVVLAAILGAGFAGRLVGFNFVESAITAGLCMANMGGTGDVAVLSASRRMGLMPFARMSTSFGGGLIIILCGLVVPFLQALK